jgi:hypothetical protein
MLIIPLSIPIESKYKPRKGIVIAKDLSKLIHKGKKIMLINDTNEISVEEFNWLRPWHHISEEERLSKLSDKLWLYTIRYFSPIQPKPFKIQKS